MYRVGADCSDRFKKYLLPVDPAIAHWNCALCWTSMTGPHNAKVTSDRSLLPSGRATLRYWFFFVVQTTGAAILFWYTVPLFRQVLLASGSHVPRTENLVWSLSAIALMQAGYWIGCRLRPPLLGVRNTFIGHVILFVARMSFVLGTSVFGFVFIVRRPEFYIPTSRYVVLIMGLFALFCYTHELEQLGRALIGQGSRPRSD
jgi:hypothetical protein